MQLVTGVMRASPPLKNLNLDAISGDPTEGEEILDALLNNDITTIESLDLSGVFKWWRNSADCFEMLLALVGRQSNLKEFIINWGKFSAA